MKIMGGKASDISSPKLLDEEAKVAAKRRALISRVTLEIEKILLREDFTMGELGEVMDMFNSRAHSVFSKTKLKDVKKSYDRN